MIFGAWALTLNILTIGILSFGFALLLMSLLINLVNRLLLRFEAKTRARLLWCVVALPWFVSLVSVVLIVFPEVFKWQETWLTSTLHLHHTYAFPIYSWHGVSLFLFSTLSFLLLLSKLISASKNTSHIGQLQDFLQPTPLPNGCMLIESDRRHAFTSGILNPKAYITRGLHDLLTETENRVVQQHELAHVKHADPLRKYAFSVLASFFPGRLVIQLNSAFSLALEQLADSVVLKTSHNETLISKTILKVVRLQNIDTPGQSEPLFNCAFTTHPLELRIRYLLSDDKGHAFPHGLVLLSTLTLVLISTFSVDLLHHYFEHLSNH